MKRKVTSIIVGEMFGKWKVINIDKNNLKGNYKVTCSCDCGRTTKELYSPQLTSGSSTQCIECNLDNVRLSMKEYIEKLKKMNSPVQVKDVNTLGERKYFKNRREKIIHICPVCGEDWNTSPNSTLRGSRMCDKCNNKVNESLVARVCKQVIKKYFRYAKPEHDLGFKGDKGRVSKYDIYIPELNMVIEFQSAYHDDKDKKIHDKKKKEFVINKGLRYIAIDHRNVTPLQAIKLFFPWLTDIPDYVNIENNTIIEWDIDKAQSLLNDGYSYQEVANEINVSYNTIACSIVSGKLIKPKDYIFKQPNSRKVILKFNKQGVLIGKYEYALIIDDVSISKLREACCGMNSKEYMGHKYKDFIWLYQSDYEKLTKQEFEEIFQVEYKKKIQVKHRKPVVRINIKNMECFEYEALSFTYGFDISTVSKACKGKFSKSHNGHKYKGYLWYYKSDYEKIIKDSMGQAG